MRQGECSFYLAPSLSSILHFSYLQLCFLLSPKRGINIYNLPLISKFSFLTSNILLLFIPCFCHNSFFNVFYFMVFFFFYILFYFVIATNVFLLHLPLNHWIQSFSCRRITMFIFFFLFQIFFSVSYSCTLLTMQLSFDRSCTLFFFINSALTLRYFLIHSTILFQVFFCSFYIIKIFPLGAFCPLFEFHPSLEARIPNLRFSNALPRFLLTIRKIK